MARSPWAPRPSSWETFCQRVMGWVWVRGWGERLGGQVKTGSTCWSRTEPSFPLAAPNLPSAQPIGGCLSSQLRARPGPGEAAGEEDRLTPPAGIVIQGHVLSPWKRPLHSLLLPILPLLLAGDSPVSWTLIRSVLTLERHPVTSQVPALTCPGERVLSQHLSPAETLWE